MNPHASMIHRIAAVLGGVVILAGSWFMAHETGAFTGPSQGAGTGGGYLSSDSAGNLAVGTSTQGQGQDFNARFTVTASTSDANFYGLRVTNKANTVLFESRNDNKLRIGSGSTFSSLSTLSVAGGIVASSTDGSNRSFVFPDGTSFGSTKSLTADYIAGGDFGSLVGGGNYKFVQSTALVVQSALNVGTSSAVSSTPLAVYGSSTFYGNITLASGTPSVVFGNGGPTLSVPSAGILSASNAKISVNTSTATYRVNVGGDVLVGGNIVISSSSAAGLYFSDGTSIMTAGSLGAWTIGSGGTYLTSSSMSVGIGTSTPQQKVSIVNTSTDTMLGLYRGITTSTILKVGTDSAFVITNQGTDVIQAKSGSVGINMSPNSSYKLDVNGASRFYNTQTMWDNAADRGYISYSASPNRFVVMGAANNSLSLGSDNTFDYLFIATSSNVGIGNTAPGYKLSVSGDINTTGVYRVNSTGGASTNCSAGQAFTGSTISGGIITTAGSCTAVPTSVITSLNGQTGATQTFATSTTGSGFDIQSSGNIHTLRIGTAGASNSGLLTTTDWNTFNNKGNTTASGGSSGWVPKFTGSTTIGTSTIQDSGSMITLVSTTVSGSFQIGSGGGTIKNIGPNTYYQVNSMGWYVPDSWVIASDLRSRGGYVYGGASDYEMIRGADTWLRLNQAMSFTSGTYTPTIFRADGGVQVDGLWAIADGNQYHYTYGSSKYDVFGTVNGSGWGVDANNTSNWDLLVYNGGELYYSHVYLGYGGTAGIYTYDANENLNISPNGSGKVMIQSGSGKLDAGTIDPPYVINGERFATYVPAMIGQKEETSDVVMLSDAREKVLDFKNAEKGSDLWLFAKVTDLKKNFDRMVVLLTPSFEGQVWYEKDTANLRLVIRGSAAGEVSYRLTAPRFDSEKWPNKAEEEGGGFIINDEE